MKNMFCDKCKKQFNFKENQVRIDTVADGVLRYFFKCPHCKNKFIIMYQDNEVRKNLKKMKQIQGGQNTEKDIDVYEKLYYRNLEISESYKKIFGR